MVGKKLVLFGIFLVCFGYLLSSMTYEANGEVYMLIPDGLYKGVYKMNNTTGGTPTALFTIESGYIATKIRVNPEGKLYTFLIKKDADYQEISGNIPVRINYTTSGSDTVFYGKHAYHHMYHSFPSGTAITAKNHYGPEDPSNPVNTNVTPATPTTKPDWYIPYGWDADGDGVADPGAPACTTNWFLVPNGSIYHSFIRAIGYDTNNSTTTNDGKGVDIEDNTAQTRSDGGFKSYYTIHETQYKKDSVYYLQTYYNGSLSKNEVARSRQLKRELEFKNGCHDGCISSSSTKNFEESPYKQDIAVSTYGDTYFYQRKINGASYTRFEKNGSAIDTSAESIIGSLNYADYIAVSSKDTNKDWIYLLNDSVVASWVGATSVNIDQIVVSDQWWQDGGIIFALDSGAKKVYVIERNERMTNEADKIVKSYSITVPEGVDSIGTDGYANLYICVNSYEPNPVVGLVSEISYVKDWHLSDGKWTGTGVIYQTVYKTVYRYNYYNNYLSSSLIGKVFFGKNTYYVTVTVNSESEKTDPSKWNVDSSTLDDVDLVTVYPAEITAVNYSAPPQVNGYRPARIDIDGPYEISGTDFIPVSTSNYEGLKENTFYVFQVENYPIPNIVDYKTNPFGDRAVNTRSGEGDNATGLLDASASNVVDLPSYKINIGGQTVEVNYKGSGYQKGGFVSTLCYSTQDHDGNGLSDNPKFRWVLKQVYNRYGEKKDKIILDTDWCDTPLLGVMLDGGVYDLYVASRYCWFDYNQLNVGDLSSKRWDSSVFKADVWAQGAQALDDPITGTNDNYCAHYRFNVLMTGESMTAEGKIVATTGVAIDSSGKWVIDEDTKEIWQIKDKDGAAVKKIDIMKADTPPDPPGVSNLTYKKWVFPVELKVKVELKDSSGNYIYENVLIKHSALTEGAASDDDFKVWTGADDPASPLFDESEFLSIPSDPMYYKFSIFAHRKYEYGSKVVIKQYDPVTGLTNETELPMTYQRVVGLYAETEVLVRDIMGSDDVKLEGNPTYTYYVTSGDDIKFDVTNPVEIDTLLPSGVTYNPGEITLIISDDNPFDPLSSTSPLGYHKQGESPTNKNPSFDTFLNQDTNWNLPSSVSHRQEVYGRLSYETFVPGVDSSLATLAGYTSAIELIENLSSPTCSYYEFRKKYEDNRKNHKGIKYSIPDGNSPDTGVSDWSSYFSGNGNIDIVEATDGDLGAFGITRQKSRSYYKVTLKMDQLLKYLRWEVASDFSTNWTAKGPDCNKVGGELGVYFTFSDSSGNRNKYNIAQIKVRDNDDPNVFLKLNLPRKNAEFIIPDNIKKATYLIEEAGQEPVFVYSYYNNGPWEIKWVSNPSSADAKHIDLSKLVYPSSMTYGFPVEDTARAYPKPMLALDKGIPEDTRILMTIIPLDNCGGVKVNSQLDVGIQSYTFDESQLTEYVIFSEPKSDGYLMSGEVKDSALDWNGNPHPNKRNFKFLIGPVLKLGVNAHYLGR